MLNKVSGMVNAFQIHVLHGFLGLPGDWGFLEKDGNFIDLFNSRPINGLWSWAKTFNRSVKEANRKKVLVGYSLGGRLALHALLDRPKLWDGAVIVSANPGLQDLKEKQKRLANDLQWSQRFLSEPWEKLMEDWNAQPVFSGDDCKLVRQEKNYSRSTLANVLDVWSLGRQEDLRQSIQNLSIPILWIAGERDQKFTSIARSLQFSHPQSKVWIAAEAGHSVPWQLEDSFKQELDTFLKEIL